MAKKARVTHGTYDKKSPKFGFHTWSLDTFERLNELLEQYTRKIVKESIEIATKEYECDAYFWRDYHETGEPGLIAVGLPLGEDESEMPVWKFSILQMVDNMIDGHKWQDGSVDEDEAPRFLAVRGALLDAAAKIDAALARK